MDYPRHYRYVTEAIFTEDGIGLTVNIKLLEFEAVRETKHGYWLVDSSMMFYYNLQRTDWVKKRFVLKQSRIRFAYPTKQEAFRSYNVRVRKRIGYLNRDLEIMTVVENKLKDFKI